MNENKQKVINTTIALAGMFQAAALVRDLAKTGTTIENAFQTSIQSIYKIDAANTADVYGNLQGLQVGFSEIIRLFGNERVGTDPSISRYVISMIHLESKIKKNKELLATLTKRIKHAVSQAEYFSSLHPTVIASLADIYITTLGKLPFRIQVLGQMKFLNQEEVVQKIRAALLAGVRSAVLWRQMGGRRWQLFFWRNKITKQAQQYLRMH